MSDVKPVIFISYARKDEPDKPKPGEVKWRTYVQSYLAPAGMNGIVHIWVDEGIRGGNRWKKEIETQLKTCDLFILLVSINSLASDVVVNFEIKTIQERQAKGENVHIFPIILEPFPKKAVPWLMELNLRPNTGKPLSAFSAKARKSEMATIADEVVEIITQVVAEKELARPTAPVEEPKTTQGVVETAAGRVFIDIAHLPETAYERLVGRETELKRLDDGWTDLETNILSLIAEGGAGKSALVNEWLKRMQADNYRGAEFVLGWSFYSQGTKERATSAEQFLNWALDRLGVKVETTSATTKGEAIAEALAQRRVLLLLDGCEPLQHGLDKQQGELKDQSLRALLRRLAAMPPVQTLGFVVLTSRLPIKNIAHWEYSTAPVIDVEKLSDQAGSALLRDNGVWGTDGELQAAGQDFGGHPLALGLLASFLKERHFGDVRQRDRIRGLLHDEENPRHDHARRVMESYEKEWLGAEPVEHAIMRLVGLFDRPASGDCLLALRQKPVIPGLTDALPDLDKSEWQRAVARLRDARLLAPVDRSAPDALDAHPLVREWFGERLRKTNEKAWKAAHGRIYEYLRDSARKSKTPTLEDLSPLYQAIPHGCRSGRHQEAFDDLYIDRICQRNAQGLEFYARNKLGTFDSDLAAISWFFDLPYEKPVATLTAARQSWVLGDAAACLRAQGRYAEALPAIRATLNNYEKENSLNSAIAASNLSEAELIVGEIGAAVIAGKRSVVLADQIGDSFEMLYNRTTYADALHAAGQFEQAERLFAEAEQRQFEYQPSNPLLYSLGGYKYCDLLIAKSDYSAVRDRAAATIVIARRNNWLLDIGLDTMTLGRSHLGLALSSLKGGQSLSAAREHALSARARSEEAVEGLRNAGTADFYSRGLLARVAFRRSVGDWDGAARDLDEVEEIAAPGPMNLYRCDMALERARLALAKVEAFAPLNQLIDSSSSKPDVPDAAELAQLKQEAATQLSIAANYIKIYEYHRRDEELAELQAVLRSERKFGDLPPRV
jgi:hypothetical protein